MVLLRYIVLVTAVSVTAAADKRQAPGEGDFSDRSSDGSYAFRYADRNQFHVAAANKDNVVSGRYTCLGNIYILHLRGRYTFENLH